jgi:hypothetical protein
MRDPHEILPDYARQARMTAHGCLMLLRCRKWSATCYCDTSPCTPPWRWKRADKISDTKIAILSQYLYIELGSASSKTVKHYDELCNSRWPRSSHAKMMIAGSVNGRLRPTRHSIFALSLVPTSETVERATKESTRLRDAG